MSDKKDPALCPEELTFLKVSKPKSFAGGFPAVTSSMGQIHREAGLIKGSAALLKLNQKDGFDCPSCAWPDPDGHRAAAEFCENGAKALASETSSKRITREFFAKHSVEELGAKSDHWHELQGRLTEPMVLAEGHRHYLPISWSEAYQLIASELNSLPSPDDVIFYTSGRASNEAAFLYQLFARQFGTNNLPDCSNMCHESSGVALNKTIGIGKGTVKLEDFYHADVVMIMGQNPGTNHPRMLAALQECVKNGGKIIAINPLKEAGLLAFAHPQHVSGILGKSIPLSSLYLQVKPGGDHALLKAIAKGLLERDAIDQSFVTQTTRHFDEYKKSITTESWDDLIRISGISREDIDAVVEQLAKTNKIITCWAMGLTQHRRAVPTIEEIVNLHLLRGSVGIANAGLCPVRGHSNVQGDRTMGIFERMPESFLQKLDEVFTFKSPRKHGYDTVEAIQAMKDEPGKVFIALGGNFLSATPDTAATAEALRNCALTVHISTKLNRSHLVPGKRALILPCLGRSERDNPNGIPQFVTVENSMGVVHSSKGKFPPASEDLQGEPTIVANIAKVTLGKRTSAPWNQWQFDYRKIRDAIEKVVPGFEDFNARVSQPGGFYLPNHAREGQFEKVGGKVPFQMNEVKELELGPDQLVLMTIRSHDQFNTTVYGMDDRYRGIFNERRVILMNTADMEERGISHLQPVTIRSHSPSGIRKADNFLAVTYDIPRQAAAAYFPEANILVPLDSTAEQSNTPVSKGVIITVAPK